MGTQRGRAISSTTDFSGPTVLIPPSPTPDTHLTAAPDSHSTTTPDQGGSDMSQPTALCPLLSPAPHTEDTPCASSLKPPVQKRILDYYTPQAKRRRTQLTPTPSPNTHPTRTDICTRQVGFHTAPFTSEEHTHTMGTPTHAQATHIHRASGAAEALAQLDIVLQPTAVMHAALEPQPSPRNGGLGSGCPQQNSSAQTTVRIQPQSTAQ